ncbi:hypothetical protein ES703_102771 [subsurface metagenome]
MAQEIAFAAPGTEEMTKTAVGVVGAGMTGVIEGVIVKNCWCSLFQGHDW